MAASITAARRLLSRRTSVAGSISSLIDSASNASSVNKTNAKNFSSLSATSNNSLTRSINNNSNNYNHSVIYRRNASSFLASYDEHVAERSTMANGAGVAPKPLDPTQCQTLIDEIKSFSGTAEEGERLVDIISNRVPPGVDEAAYVKAAYLSAVAKGEETSVLISRELAITLLGCGAWIYAF